MLAPMAVSRELLDHIADQLREFGPLAFRRMFSGAGLFRGGRMFGLVARDVLYFKVGEADRGAYIAAGCKPFTYQRLGRTATLTSYYEVPAEVFDDRDRLAQWARAACAAAAANSAVPRKQAKRRRA
jgi:DNA transformation protein